MNTTIKFHPLHSARRLSVAFLSAALALCFLVPSTRAKDRVPFEAVFVTSGESVMEPPILHIEIHGQGVALHLGAATAVTTDQTLNLVTLEATATYTLTAANGDTLKLAVELDYTLLPAGISASGEYSVTGGTGRFAVATGSGTVMLLASFTGSDSALGSLSFEGTISPPGSR